MRGLAIGIALGMVLLLLPAGNLLLVLLLPLAFFALLRYRTTWQPVSTPYRPVAGRPGQGGTRVNDSARPTRQPEARAG